MTKLSTIRQVSVNARDVARATAFYRDALGVKHLFDAGPGLSFFDDSEGNVLAITSEVAAR